MEGRLHKLFKVVVKKKLLEGSYTVYVEPSKPRWKGCDGDCIVQMF